jgi:PAS domain S-box-containing protein
MSSVTILYIITILVSIAIAFLLVQLSKLSGQGAVTAGKKRIKGAAYSGSSMLSESPLKHTIFDEISELAGSVQQCQEISTRLLSAVSEELEKRIELNNKELTKKYERIVEEKTKNEEVAWDKYNRVLNAKKETEAVIRSVAEGVVVVDAEGKVIMMNPAAERLLGVSSKEKIGKSLLEGLKEEQLISLAKNSPNKGSREIELVSAHDETKKVLRASTAVVENENGQTVGMVSVLSDITKQKELDRMKENFVASVSHELRTPLVAIDKSLSLILDKNTGEINETQKQFISIAERNLKRLGLLVNDLLDLSKLEAGKMELKRQPSSIDKVIRESVDGLKNWAETKSIHIETRIEQNLPDLNINPEKVIQVLNNIIGNAIKFTPEKGSIFIEAKLNNRGREVRVSVADTGIGITQEDLPRVFDKFYQSGERVSTDITGTGIGLAIAKEIVQLHGGKIWAESEKGSGAKFIFSLPL